MYEKVIKNFIFPLQQKLLGGPALAFIDEWEKTQWLSADELRALQFEKLTKLLVHAAHSVPYYRESFKRIGFEPGDLKTLDDLAGLPVLDKSDLRAHAGAFVTEGLTETLGTAKTGGSTGEPLVFPIGASMRSTGVANMARCRRWWGVETGDRAANFWGHSRYIKATARDRVRKALNSVKNRILNRVICSAYDLSEESMERYQRRLADFRPAFIIGYATSLYVFADFLRQSGRDGATPGLKVVISTAEVLYDWQREVIEETFGCKVANEYGMCEAGIVAYECPQGSMHVMDESVIVETLPVEGSVSGDIVITQLENPAVPLIRYNTKDMARRVEGPCACGRGLSRITPVEGRAYDIVYASDGRVVAGALLTHTMKSVPKVARYQIVQRDLNNIDVAYVESEPLGESELAFIRDTIKRHLGANVAVTLERRDEIARELSGKHRWLKSMVTAGDAAAARGGAR
jgi:phenylacetate-CoA ligase